MYDTYFLIVLTAFANSSTNQNEARDELDGWTWLSNVPGCWEVVQPLLCSVYLPACALQSDNTSAVVLPGSLYIIGRGLLKGEGGGAFRLWNDETSKA